MTRPRRPRADDDDPREYVREQDLVRFLLTRFTQQDDVDRNRQLARALIERRDQLLTPQEAAARLHTTPHTVAHLVRTHRLLGLRVLPRLLRIPLSQVEALLAQRRH